MAKFQIYQYMFRPVMENQLDIPFDEFTQIDVNKSLKNKQKLMTDILDMFSKKQKSEEASMTNDIEIFRHLSYYGKGGIYVMRIANNKMTKMERDFNVKEFENHPSCVVIIDNRKDRQIIAIERNSAFRNSGLVATILQNTFRKHLSQYRLAVDVCGKFHASKFWIVVRSAMQLNGVESVDFPFPYPNLPAISDRVGDYFKDWGKRTNSEPTLHLQGQNKESVKLEEDDELVLGAVEACAASGRPIKLKPKGMHTRLIGVNNPVLEDLDSRILRKLGDKDLFDSHIEQIIEFLNNIKLVYE